MIEGRRADARRLFFVSCPRVRSEALADRSCGAAILRGGPSRSPSFCRRLTIRLLHLALVSGARSSTSALATASVRTAGPHDRRRRLDGHGVFSRRRVPYLLTLVYPIVGDSVATVRVLQRRSARWFRARRRRRVAALLGACRHRGRPAAGVLRAIDFPRQPPAEIPALDAFLVLPAGLADCPLAQAHAPAVPPSRSGHRRRADAHQGKRGSCSWSRSSSG